MDIFVKFWGTRGSIPTPGEHTQRYGGNTSCVEVRHGDTLIICDAGSGIRELGEDLLLRSDAPIVGHLLFSHSHWDHIQGFPFFSPAYRKENRFFVHGRHPGDDRIYQLLSGQMESDYFPISFQAFKAEIRPSDLDSAGKRIGEVGIAWIPLRHPGGCLAYALSVGVAKVVYMTDQELLLSEAGPTDELRPMPDELIDFVRGADLLIGDGQYTDEEYLERVGWGHSSCFTVVDLALRGQVKHLALFHHEPSRSDLEIDELVDACRRRVASQNGSLLVSAAREGVEYRFPSTRGDQQIG